MLDCLAVVHSGVMFLRLRNILREQHSFHVDHASDYPSALQYCNQRMPDLILLDLISDTKAASDVIHQIRTKNEGHKPRFLILVDEDKVMELGDFLREGNYEAVISSCDSDMLTAKLSQMGVL